MIIGDLRILVKIGTGIGNGTIFGLCKLFNIKAGLAILATPIAFNAPIPTAAFLKPWIFFAITNGAAMAPTVLATFAFCH